jgi:hypothetical protein
VGDKSMFYNRDSVAVAFELFPAYGMSHGKVKSVLRHGAYLINAIDGKCERLKNVLQELFIEELHQVNVLKTALFELGFSLKILESVLCEPINVKCFNEKRTVCDVICYKRSVLDENRKILKNTKSKKVNEILGTINVSDALRIEKLCEFYNLM